MEIKYGPYSASRLNTADCPYSFYRQYVDTDRKKADEGLAQARGSAVHEVYEKITESFRTNRDWVPDGGVISQWVTEAIHRHPAAYQELNDIMQMCRNYIARPIKFLTDDAGIEERLAVKLVHDKEGRPQFEECDFDDKQAFFRGRVDVFVLADDLKSATIVDHKTQPNIETSDTFQMGCYAWLTWKHHPYLERISTVLHFARYGCYSEPVEWTVDLLQEIEETLLTKIHIIETMPEFQAVPHKDCQYCPVMTDCPKLAEYFERDDHGHLRVKSNSFECFGDTQKAVSLTGLKQLMSEVSSVITKNLKKHVEAYGPIAIPGKVLGFKASTSPNWDAVNKKLRPEVYKVFEKYGIDPKTYMSFNQTSSSGMFKIENHPLQQELGALIPLSTSTKFDLHSSLI